MSKSIFGCLQLVCMEPDYSGLEKKIFPLQSFLENLLHLRCMLSELFQDRQNLFLRQGIPAIQLDSWFC